MSGRRPASRAACCEHCSLPVPSSRQAGPAPWFCCFGCRVAHGLATPSGDAATEGEPAPSTLFLRLGLGIFLTLNVMGASWLSYSRDLVGSGGSSPLLHLANYLALFLTTLVVILLGLPLATDTVAALLAPLRREQGAARLLSQLGARINAQLLIVVGVFSAYFLSIVHTVRGHGSLYFDTTAAILVVVTLGSHLEAGARRRASSSSRKLLSALPRRARVERHGALTEVPLSEVRVGDRVAVPPGETVPVDGRVDQGRSRVDDSSLTGESRPHAVERGDSVLAGSLNHEGLLWIEAVRVADDTVLGVMERSLEEGRNRRPGIQRAADRVAAWFVPSVMVLAVSVFALEARHGDPEGGLLRALAVLLISCPCALGLAAPLACWQGLRRAAERGILIDSPATLERAARVRELGLDKTGTLTAPELSLTGVATAHGVEGSWAVETAARLDAASTHPIAKALVAHARERGLDAGAIERVEQVPGLGVEGLVDGRLLRLGSRRWLQQSGIGAAGSAEGSIETAGLEAAGLEAPEPETARRGHEEVEEADSNRSGLYLFDEQRVLARFDLDETLKSDATELVAGLGQLGIRPFVLSGDGARATERLAARLGIEGEGALLPDDKVRHLLARRRTGRGVAMVGDGINDSPVLAAADVGIAVGSASDLASRSGNVRLTTDRLGRIVELFAISRDVQRRIRANLTFAFGFNGIGIGLAVSGHLTPIFAAIAMIVSSLAVVGISSGAGRRPEGRPNSDAPGDPRGNAPAMPLTPVAEESRG